MDGWLVRGCDWMMGFMAPDGSRVGEGKLWRGGREVWRWKLVGRRYRTHRGVVERK